MLDLHGVPAAAPDAIEIGSADGRSVQALPGADALACRFLRERLSKHLERRGKTVSLGVDSPSLLETELRGIGVIYRGVDSAGV